MGRPLTRHVVLVGLPGAGKSTAGRLAAALLDTGFTDLDDRIASAAGRSIPAIFAEEGEPAFRDLERQAMDRVLAEPPGVVAPGGGWVAQPGALDAVGGRAFLIYLHVTPETAVARLGGAAGRPLLADDPLGVLTALAARRDTAFARADARVETDHRTVQDVAETIAALARKEAGL